MFGLGMRLPRESRDKTRTLHARVLRVLCDLMNYCMMVCMSCFMYVLRLYVCLVISTWRC